MKKYKKNINKLQNINTSKFTKKKLRQEIQKYKKKLNIINNIIENRLLFTKKS